MAPSAGGPWVVAVDLGGTKCHAALADGDGTIIAEHVRPSPASGAEHTVLEIVAALRAQAAARGTVVAAVAIGVPGTVEPGSGRIFGAFNVGWHGFALVDHLAGELTLPLVVENDADLAGLGEGRHGLGRGLADFVVLAIGTGIGAAIVADGRLLRGSHHAAGEVGGLVLERAWLAGRSRLGPGRLELFAAGPGLARAAGQDSSEAALIAAAGGERRALVAIESLLDRLAMAIIAIAVTVDPQRVILDGGLGRALAPRLSKLADRVARHVATPPELCVSTLHPTATLVGAIDAALDLAHGRPAALAADALAG